MALSVPDTPTGTTAPDWYTVLQLEPHASPADIDAAYHRQRALYDPAHGASMGDDFAEQAVERLAVVEAAYAVLSNPGRRFAYDQERGLVGTEAVDRRGISNREVMWTILGVLGGLLLLSLVYNLTARQSKESGLAQRFTSVNYPAAAIDLRTLDGGRFSLADYRGKVVLINFWATWCEPCKRETPALQASYARLRDQGLEIVGVNLYQNEQAYNRGDAQIRAFVEQYGVDYPIAVDEDGRVTRSYKFYDIPVSFVVDPNGNVRYIRTSELTEADIEWAFQSLKQT